MEKHIPEDKNKQRLNDYGKYSAIAFQMGAIIAIGVWGGYALDKYFHFEFPVFILILSLMSVAAAIYFAVKYLTNNK